MVNIIFATGVPYEDGRLPIGKDGKLPWHHSRDLKWFKKTTLNHTVIMGRNTWESLGCKPLPRRRNIVVSASLCEGAEACPALDEIMGFEVYPTLEEAIDVAQKDNESEIFIIGGSQLYKYAIDNELADRIYVDFLDIEVEDADTFFPLNKYCFYYPYMDNRTCERISGDAKAYEYDVHYARMHRGNEVDSEYLSTLHYVMWEGKEKKTRSGDVLSVFGETMRFDLSEGLPVLTTKKMFTKGCIHELLWFLKGDTNIKYLVDNGVHIWDDDAFRYAITELENRPHPEKWRGMTKERFIEYVKVGESWGSYAFGDLGPVYGIQWTKWGRERINQIEEVIKTLRTNPDDRRMIVSAWNPEDIPYMALPPCHYCFQFYSQEMTVEERFKLYKKKFNLSNSVQCDLGDKDLDKAGIPRRKLSCMWNQRSVDMGLGLPFNILSYAILTHMVAQCVDMAVGELIFVGGDCHIYKNQLEGLKEQCDRDPFRYSSPELVLNPEIKEISQFTYDDIKIVGYHSYPTIKLPLSVG